MYTDLVRYAEHMAEILTVEYKDKKIELAYFPLLAGIGNYALRINDGAEHNYYAAIDGIHNYYARTKDEYIKTAYR
jgi:hypothetical protein